jgi:ribonuclease BN (tRNA processing enzyme)
MVLLDCGSGVFPALADIISPDDLSAIWISHMHPDHSADLITLANWALNKAGSSRLRVIGPRGWDRRLNAFISSNSSRNLVREIFNVEYIDDDWSSSVGEFTLKSQAVHHSVTSYGVRISAKDSEFAYSGDSGPCEALHSLAANVDVLLCEAGTRTPAEYHMTIQEAYELALAATVGRLLITHTSSKTLPVDLAVTDGLSVDIVAARDVWMIAPNNSTQV